MDWNKNILAFISDRNGQVPSVGSFRSDAHGGDESVRVAVRAGGGDQTRDRPLGALQHVRRRALGQPHAVPRGAGGRRRERGRVPALQHHGLAGAERQSVPVPVHHRVQPHLRCHSLRDVAQRAQGGGQEDARRTQRAALQGHGPSLFGRLLWRAPRPLQRHHPARRHHHLAHHVLRAHQRAHTR